MRTQEEIIRDLIAGILDVGDVKIQEKVVLEKIDCSGDEKKLVERRTYIDGECDEVLKF